MIELLFYLIVAFFAITLGIVFLWALVRVPFALIGSIVAEHDRRAVAKRRAAAAKLAQGEPQ
jgi:hypothetical protein